MIMLITTIKLDSPQIYLRSFQKQVSLQLTLLFLLDMPVTFHK